MYARVRELLTPEERLQYLQIPPDLGEWELGTYFTFTQHDLEIIQQRRRDYNRLGFAVQLCVLRYIGWTLSDVKEVHVSQAKRKGIFIVVFLIDCDNFKSINDTYGHKRGDIVLTRLVSLLKESIRKGGIIARWGGDEFLIIVPSTTEESLKEMIENFENQVKQLSEEMSMDIRFSVGSALFPNDAVDFESLVKAADEKYV